MSKIFIGTSGWVYSDWIGIFYPPDLPARERLRYYSQHFKTTEINYSFYRLPRPSTYQQWYSQTSVDFIFAVKASRFITHIKRLKGVEKFWKQFIENTSFLKEKLGPVLFQFPPSFKADKTNIKQLANFLKYIGKNPLLNSPNLRYAFEFRNNSWCDKKIYDLLKKHNAGWVISDSPSFPKVEVVTSDFIYIRMHGSKILFASRYSNDELDILSQKIKNWQKNCDIFVYFNNDFSGYAIKNAKYLIDKLSKI